MLVSNLQYYLNSNTRHITSFLLNVRAFPVFLECNANLKIETPKDEPFKFKITDLNERPMEEHRVAVKQYRLPTYEKIGIVGFI